MIEASQLTPYATVFRYPGEADDPDMNEALQALNTAERLFSELLLRLPAEIRDMLA